MAKAQTKSGGPTRGRNKTKMMGMGSGKFRAKRRASNKGKRG